MGVPIADKDNVTSQKDSEPASAAPLEGKPRKDLIGNCKEFRIDCNKNALRIIGNGNKIRINQNSGSLDIIGNGTRVKITNNSGAIRYTGNCGRIYLGSESAEQDVDYIGCNGLLKVVNATELRAGRSSTSTDRQEKCKSSSSTYSTSSSSSSSFSDTESGRKQKGATSTSSTSSCSGFNIKNNISLPNLSRSGCRKSANITNCINFYSSTGDIVIKNAINVSI